jgi:hypothetical protein
LGDFVAFYSDVGIPYKESPSGKKEEASPLNKGYYIHPMGRHNDVSPSKRGISLNPLQSNLVGWKSHLLKE